MNEKIVVHSENGIGWIIFNNAEKRNAVSLAMAKRVAEVIKEFEKDEDVRVLIVKGEGGKAFVSGADISEFEELRSTPEGIKLYAETTDQMYHGLRNCEKATVAMIQGYCMGGGVAVACACDFRICTTDAMFAVPAARLGIAYGPHFSRWVVEAVGPSSAKEILMTARRYSAEQALSLGLVNHMVKVPEIEEFTLEYAMTIAKNAPLSVSAAKGIVNQVSKSPIDWDQELCSEWMRRCTTSEDYKEGRHAFMEKRQPEFKGV